MDRQFLMEYLRRLRRRRKICLRQSILYLDLCAAAPGRFFACAGDLPQISHGFHPGYFLKSHKITVGRARLTTNSVGVILFG